MWFMFPMLYFLLFQSVLLPLGGKTVLSDSVACCAVLCQQQPHPAAVSGLRHFLDICCNPMLYTDLLYRFGARERQAVLCSAGVPETARRRCVRGRSVTVTP